MAYFSEVLKQALGDGGAPSGAASGQEAVQPTQVQSAGTGGSIGAPAMTTEEDLFKKGNKASGATLSI